MRNCPECEREMYHWQCACGFRTPKPAVSAKPVASAKPQLVHSQPGPSECPDCTRAMVGNACRCGYRRPGTPAVLPSTPPARLTEEQKNAGRANIAALKEMLNR